MKKLVLFVIPAILLVSGCGDSGQDKVRKNSQEVLTDRDIENQSNYMGTIHLTREDFLARVMNYEKNPEEWVFEGNKPCLIDFYAEWCAPCRITSPILEDLAKEFHGRIHIYKVDTDKEQELAMVFGIQSIPSFLFCPMEGKPVMSAGIARSPEETKQMFRNQIENILLKRES